MIEIYTDGSCLKNPNGPGGWAFCIIENDYLICNSGNNKSTTNNRMELQAIIEALKYIKEYKEKRKYIIFSDSKLCINCGSREWKRKANLDLWKIYDLISTDINFEFEWVKGHSGNKYNDLVDKLANEESSNII